MERPPITLVLPSVRVKAASSSTTAARVSRDEAIAVRSVCVEKLCALLSLKRLSIKLLSVKLLSLVLSAAGQPSRHI